MTERFDSYLWEAVYRWSLANQLDPIIYFSDGEKQQFLYADESAVREAQFTKTGFSCLSSRDGHVLRFELTFDQLLALVVGDQSTHKELVNTPLILRDPVTQLWREQASLVDAKLNNANETNHKARKIQVIRKQSSED